MTPATKRPIEFYFDFISPFGYFAGLRIDDLARRHGREVEWTSMLVGVSVLKVMGIPAIVELPLKGPYVVNDAKRYARQHRVAFNRASPSATSRPVELLGANWMVPSATSDCSCDGTPPMHGPGLVLASAGITQIAT